MKFLLFILVIFSLSTQADKFNYPYYHVAEKTHSCNVEKFKKNLENILSKRYKELTLGKEPKKHQDILLSGLFEVNLMHYMGVDEKCKIKGLSPDDVWYEKMVKKYDFESVYQNLDTSLFQMIYSKYLKRRKKTKIEKIEYVPSFECNKKSLLENIDFYKKSFFAKRGDSAVIKEELGDDFERAVFLNPDVIITYRAYESYIKKCDDFSDFISKDEESPYRIQEVPGFADYDLNYLLNVILLTQNLEAFKKLIAQGLQIDILFSTIEFTVPDPDDLNIVILVMRCEDEIVASNMNFHLKRRAYATPEFKEYLIKQGSVGSFISAACVYY